LNWSGRSVFFNAWIVGHYDRVVEHYGRVVTRLLSYVQVVDRCAGMFFSRFGGSILRDSCRGRRFSAPTALILFQPFDYLFNDPDIAGFIRNIEHINTCGKAPDVYMIYIISLQDHSAIHTS
jgi:hypothetical protein